MPKYQEELKYQRAPDARTIRVAGGTIVNFWQQGDAELLGGYTSGNYPRKSEDAYITGQWTFDGLTGAVQNAVVEGNTGLGIGGSLFVGQGVGTLAEDLALPDNMAAGDILPIIVKDPPGGGFVFANSDIVLLRMAAPGQYFASDYSTWFVVGNRQDLGDGTQMYEGNYQTGDDNITYPAGMPILDYGASGDGFLVLSADDTNAPFLNISTHAGAPWTTTTTRFHAGNMNTEFGIAAAYYGFGAGDYAGGNYIRYETNGGFKISAGGGVCSMDGNGYKIVVTTTPSNLRSYQFTDASDNTFAKIDAYNTASDNVMRLYCDALTGKHGTAYVMGDGASASENGSVILQASRAGANVTQLVLWSHSSNGNYGTFNQDLRLAYGLYVGGTGTDPDDDCIHMDGSIKKSTALGARVYDSSDQTITTATDTTLTFDSERYDNDTIHSTVSNTSRLTATTAGLYVISANILWEANATGSRRMWILLDGTTTIAHTADVVASASTANRQTLTTQYELSASQYVELRVRQTSGGDLDVIAEGNDSPEFMMVRVP